MSWIDDLSAEEREDLRDAGRLDRYPLNNYDPCTGQYNRVTGDIVHQWERCPVHEGGK